MKRALIIGSGGQDGLLLFERLTREGWTLLGVERKSVRSHSTGVPDQPVDILDPSSVMRAVADFRPDAIFYLASYHHSAEDKLPADDAELYRHSHNVHVLGFLNILEAVRREPPGARIFYAASSHCFGVPPAKIQDETTPLNPRAGGLPANRFQYIQETKHVHVVAVAIQFGIVSRQFILGRVMIAGKIKNCVGSKVGDGTHD